LPTPETLKRLAKNLRNLDKDVESGPRVPAAITPDAGERGAGADDDGAGLGVGVKRGGFWCGEKITLAIRMQSFAADARRPITVLWLWGGSACASRLETAGLNRQPFSSMLSARGGAEPISRLRGGRFPQAIFMVLPTDWLGDHYAAADEHGRLTAGRNEIRDGARSDAGWFLVVLRRRRTWGGGKADCFGNAQAGGESCRALTFAGRKNGGCNFFAAWRFGLVCAPLYLGTRTDNPKPEPRPPQKAWC